MYNGKWTALLKDRFYSRAEMTGRGRLQPEGSRRDKRGRKGMGAERQRGEVTQVRRVEFQMRGA